VIEPAPGFELTTVTTALGELAIACSPAGVVATSFVSDGPEAVHDLPSARADLSAHERRLARALARTARREAARYLDGSLRAFTVTPDLSLVTGTFARRVLDVVATIPYGELWTYGDVAGMAGSPRAARAAGSALAACPIELFVPCHRVVHAGGSIGGYGRHEERKRWLLRLEAALDP
jgi:methylated-DNA-[protein]-cysteine S-methyltransferase